MCTRAWHWITSARARVQSAAQVEVAQGGVQAAAEAAAAEEEEVVVAGVEAPGGAT